jgi:hypothetical protein
MIVVRLVPTSEGRQYSMATAAGKARAEGGNQPDKITPCAGDNDYNDYNEGTRGDLERSLSHARRYPGLTFLAADSLDG